MGFANFLYSMSYALRSLDTLTVSLADNVEICNHSDVDSFLELAMTALLLFSH